jgi:hypothetical protein
MKQSKEHSNNMARETIVTCDNCRAVKSTDLNLGDWCVMTYPKPDPKHGPKIGASFGLAYGGAQPVIFSPAIALDLCSNACVTTMVAHIRKFGTHDRVEKVVIPDGAVATNKIAPGTISPLNTTEIIDEHARQMKAEGLVTTPEDNWWKYDIRLKRSVLPEQISVDWFLGLLRAHLGGKFVLATDSVEAVYINRAD